MADRPADAAGSDDDGQAARDAAEARRREDRITINKEFESFDAFIQEYVTSISRSGVFV